MGWYDYGGYSYSSVTQQKSKAEKRLAKLLKENPDLSPVIVEGRKIAKTWWGMAWCANLESYADYRNRIGRGSAYVKNGFVLDLKIEEGAVRAIVSGTSIYNVTIKIDPLADTAKNGIMERAGHKISSVDSLIGGEFPEEFRELFMRQGNGLFPSPKEIHLDCSCPDWADMCKHVAAVLYGVGARLDKDPLLFFKLRGIDAGELVKKSVEEKMKALLKNAGKRTGRVLDGADIEELFGL